MNAFCELPFRRCKINILGDVYQCCFQSQRIGNIFNNSIEEIWNSNLSKSIQKTTLNNKLHNICKGWGGCPYIGKELIPDKIIGDYSLPKEIEIDLPSYHCNIGGEDPSESNPACIMCPRNSKKVTNNPNYKLDNSSAIVEKIKHVIFNLENLFISGIAEPFWKNKIFDLLDIAEFKKHKDKVVLCTISNGTLFNEKTSSTFLEYTTKSNLNFSIDAATQDTYIKIRRLDFYDLIKRNVSNYCKMKDNNFHYVRITTNVNLINIHELPLMVEEAVSMGVNELCINPTHNAYYTCDLGEIILNRSNLKIFKKHEELAKRKAEELNFKLVFFRDFETVANNNSEEKTNEIPIIQTIQPLNNPVVELHQIKKIEHSFKRKVKEQ